MLETFYLLWIKLISCVLQHAVSDWWVSEVSCMYKQWKSNFSWYPIQKSVLLQVFEIISETLMKLSHGSQCISDWNMAEFCCAYCVMWFRITILWLTTLCTYFILQYTPGEGMCNIMHFICNFFCCCNRLYFCYIFHSYT